ncbi:hypothetical protein L9F63_019340, partial [Diploptera punctata]
RRRSVILKGLDWISRCQIGIYIPFVAVGRLALMIHGMSVSWNAGFHGRRFSLNCGGHLQSIAVACVLFEQHLFQLTVILP